MRDVMYRVHAELQDAHWWFRARGEIVLALLGDALRERAARANGSGARRPRIVDLGCGAGGMIGRLAALGEAVGMDASPAAVEYAREVGVDIHLGALPAPVPFADGSFDAATLLDVLEHIDDDRAALAAIRGLLRPGGILVVTVPAFPFLWSQHDELNEHRRRYVRAELREKLESAGFDVLRLSYFNTFLFPPIAAVRLAGRLGGRRDEPMEGRVPKPVNALLRELFASERWLLRSGSLPFGVSLIAVARSHGAPPAGGGGPT